MRVARVDRHLLLLFFFLVIFVVINSIIINNNNSNIDNNTYNYYSCISTTGPGASMCSVVALT